MANLNPIDTVRHQSLSDQYEHGNLIYSNLLERKLSLETVREIILKIIKRIKHIDCFKDLKDKLKNIDNDFAND